MFGEKVDAIGFSNIAFPNWAKEKNARLIQATKEDLLKYVKNNSLDLIFSHLGLTFVKDQNYILKLAVKLKPGGILVSDGYTASPQAWKELESKGFKVEVGESYTTTIITRVE